MEEVDTLKRQLDVWEVRKVSERLQKTGCQPLPTRWIDCDKNGGSGDVLLSARPREGAASTRETQSRSSRLHHPWRSSDASYLF
eukprot:4585609-Karenia_brevis.AAC.1